MSKQPSRSTDNQRGRAPGAAPKPKGARRGKPFEPGNPGGPGNPFAAKVGRIRTQLYEAATPERVAKLIEIAWKKALGEYETEVERLAKDPATGRPYKDGRTETVKIKEPPSTWHTEFLGEKIFPNMPRGFYPADEAGVPVTDEDKLHRFAEILKSAGLEDRIPLRLRTPPQLPPVIVAEQSAPTPPPRKDSRASTPKPNSKKTSRR